MTEDRPRGMSIGAVTRLTGIAADTIRTWERRYEVVEPLRDAADRRVYTDAQVERLRTISELAARGERVADLARLSSAELAERARLHQGADPSAPLRVVSLHPTLGASLAGRVDGTELSLAAHATHADGLARVEGPVDALLVDLESLGPDPAGRLGQLAASLEPRSIVLTCPFLSRPLRRRLARPELRVVRSPLPIPELRRQVVEHLRTRREPPPTAPADAAPARYSRARLEQLVNSSPELPCECPNHLASLVLELRAFEQYSRSCASASPEDAALHAELADGTARAATLLEGLLARVLVHDGLEPG